MLRNSLIREMSFKANFLLWMIVEVLWFCGQIVFFSIIFGQVDRIGDWTKWEVVLLVGTHQMIAQLFQDRKSTRLNSSHDQISYAVFCLKKKSQTAAAYIY